MSEETNVGQDRAEAPEKDVRSLISITKRALKRVRSKLQKQDEELKEALQFTLFAQIADSLLAHPEKVARGASAASIENIHEQRQEEVALDPARTVFENAEEYYRRSRKGKRGLPVIEKKLTETRGEESRCAAVLTTLELIRDDPAPEPAVAAEARTVLENLGVLPRSRAPQPKSKADSVPYRHLSLDGWDIYIGKNDAQNDELTTRFARPWDVWMHVAASPGSHVLLRRDKNAPWPQKEVLVKVASFAVWFSKAKHTSYADVNITEARFVHKRRHAPPGEVVLDRCKTMRVSPMSPQEFFGGDFDK
jgi:predicted ribosome quality control (RQC) complex YloA/Tae2 family protein